MTRKTLALSAVALCLYLPVAAQAHTTVITLPDANHPFQGWVDESRVPTPPVTLTVIETKEPCEEELGRLGGCTDGVSVIEVLPSEGRFNFRHELGHVFDQQVLTPHARGRITAWIGRGGDPWRPMAEEAFADAYAHCARPHGEVSGSTVFRLEQATISAFRLRQICGMIRKVAAT